MTDVGRASNGDQKPGRGSGASTRTDFSSLGSIPKNERMVGATCELSTSVLMVCVGRSGCETISPTLVSAKLKPPCSAFFLVEPVYTTPYCGWTMMSGVRLLCSGSLNFSLILSPAMTSSTNSSLAWLLISAATFAVCVWSCSQISAMSSSLMNPQGPLPQLLAMLT